MATTVADVALAWSALARAPLPEPRLAGLTVGLLTSPPSVGDTEKSSRRSPVNSSVAVIRAMCACKA